MDFQKYLRELTGQLVTQEDVEEVTVKFLDSGDIARVHVKCKATQPFVTATRFVYSEDVDGYQSFADGNDAELILKAIRPTPEQLAASAAAQRDVDAYVAAAAARAPKGHPESGVGDVT